MSNILEVQNLVKQYGDFTAVKGISFDIKEGEIFSLLGPNGAGKTTTISMLSTLYAPTSGDATIGGHSVTKDPMAVKQVIGVVPQDLALYAHLSVRENLTLWAALAGLPRGQVTGRVEQGLQWAGLADRAASRVHTLSGGMKRRVNLVAGTLHHPALLLLDEPTVGVDAESRDRLYDLLRDLKRRGLGVLIVTHDLHEAASLCDDVVLLGAGRVLAHGDVPTLVSSLCGLQAELVVLTQPGARVDTVLTQEGFVAVADGEWSRPGDGAVLDLAAVERRLAAAGVPVLEMRVRRPTLAGALAAALRQAPVREEAQP